MNARAEASDMPPQPQKEDKVFSDDEDKDAEARASQKFKEQFFKNPPDYVKDVEGNVEKSGQHEQSDSRSEPKEAMPEWRERHYANPEADKIKDSYGGRREEP